MMIGSSSGARAGSVRFLAALGVTALLAACGSGTVSGRLPATAQTRATGPSTVPSATPPTVSSDGSSSDVASSDVASSDVVSSDVVAVAPATTDSPAPPSVTAPSTATAPAADPAADPVGSCEYGAVGAALRPTVRVGGARVTISGARLGCAEGVMIYVADYLLTGDPAVESAATAVGTLLPGESVSLAFPSSFAQCRASAVFFETLGGDADEARLSIRQEVARWPASARAYAPAAAYVGRYPKTRILLGRNISGLGACKGKDVSNVTTPDGKVGACWTEGPASQPGRNEYVVTSCTSEHVYEVYYVKSLTFAQYTKDGAPEDTAAWAEDKALQICDARQPSIRLSGNYGRGSLGTTYVWPTGLSSLGPVDTFLTGTSWDSAQVICLARRSNNQPVRTRILR